MNRLIFIRHGATAGNLQRRYIGKTDEPLCAEGLQQLHALRERRLTADKIFVSPMLRTRQTAEYLFPQLNYTSVADFRETDFGLFEGKTAQELSGNADYQAWVDGWCRGPIPEGESVDAFKKRCCDAFRRVMETIKDEESAAFVVHGGTIMAILEAFAQPHRDYYDYHIGNGAAIFCAYHDGVIETQ